MKPIAHKVFTHLLDNKLYWSEAYQSLNISARNLLWCFFAELKFSGKWGDKNNPHLYLGNGQLSFTETEFKKQGLGSSQTYINARNQLIRVGFIKITYRGGMARGDMNKYRLLFIKEVHREHQRWRKYPEKNWEHDIPKVKDYAVGRRTRFKKKNNTLKNNTHKGINLPKELEASKETSLNDKGVTNDFRPIKPSVG